MPRRRPPPPPPETLAEALAALAAEKKRLLEEVAKIPGDAPVAEKLQTLVKRLDRDLAAAAPLLSVPRERTIAQVVRAEWSPLSGEQRAGLLLRAWSALREAQRAAEVKAPAPAPAETKRAWATKDELQAEYDKRVSGDAAPTLDDDEKWRRQPSIGIGRKRCLELRRACRAKGWEKLHSESNRRQR
jgi:hypothetical protein